VGGDGEDLVADGDQGAFGASSFHDPPVAGAQGKVVVLEAPMAASPMVAPIQGLALPVGLDVVVPAEALVVGARLTHDQRCAALGKRDISTPISPDELLRGDPADPGEFIEGVHLVGKRGEQLGRSGRPGCSIWAPSASMRPGIICGR
jgi:hypothetical protein